MAYSDTTRFHKNRREQPERHHCPACGRGGSQSVYDDGVYDIERPHPDNGNFAVLCGACYDSMIPPTKRYVVDVRIDILGEPSRQSVAVQAESSDEARDMVEFQIARDAMLDGAGIGAWRVLRVRRAREEPTA